MDEYFFAVGGCQKAHSFFGVEPPVVNSASAGDGVLTGQFYPWVPAQVRAWNCLKGGTSEKVPFRAYRTALRVC